MQSITKITLPQPCHEPWAGMSTVENGRYCSSCNKAVFDFTTMTNQQIIDHLSASSDNTCGRITAPQVAALNKQLSMPVTPHAGIWKRLMLTVTMLTSLSYVKAQTAPAKPATEQSPRNYASLGIVSTVTTKELTSMLVTGTVTDTQGKPLAQVTVAAGKQYTLTDANGAFRLQLPANIKSFDLRYIGFETTTVNINNKPGKPYRIKMKTAGMYLGGISLIKRP